MVGGSWVSCFMLYTRRKIFHWLGISNELKDREEEIPYVVKAFVVSVVMESFKVGVGTIGKDVWPSENLGFVSST